LGIFDDPVLLEKLPEAFGETLAMVGWSGLVTVLFGVPLGLLLHAWSPSGMLPRRTLYRVASLAVNTGISLPFVMLVVMALPLIRLLAGTTTGWSATVIPLALASIPFLARLVEISVRSISPGKVEAALMAGASVPQVAWDIQVREALPTLVNDFTVTLVSIVSYSAMVGVVGGGGLGYLAISHGYNRFQTGVMIVTLIVIIALVQVIQLIGSGLSRRLVRAAA
jgi:D-methionine transport system permease protein